MIYIFFKQEGFYPIELADDKDATANALSNVGTVRVERLNGSVVFDSSLLKNNIINGIGIGESSCIGVLCREFPLKRGNRFAVNASDGRTYRITNMVFENLQELIERGLTWPIRIIPLSDQTAMICDFRINKEWFKNE